MVCFPFNFVPNYMTSVVVDEKIAQAYLGRNQDLSFIVKSTSTNRNGEFCEMQDYIMTLCDLI